jgi:sporulation protein YlmC with PRC-barrel domain
MKRKLQIITSASAASLLALTALAQDSSNPKIDGTDYAQNRMSHGQHPACLKDTAKASKLIGMSVKNNQDEKQGKVEDLAVDVESGRIVEVIISTGGFMGMGNSLTAVPPEVLHQDVGHKILHLDASGEKLAAAPRFDSAHWNQCTQSNQVTDVYGYYGIQPYFVADHGDYQTTNVDGIFASSLPRNMDGKVNTAGGRTMDLVHNEEVALDVEDTNKQILTQYPNGTWTTNHFTHKNGAITSWSSLVYVQKASKLIGRPVKNLQDEKLGKVENLIVDLPAGRIVAVIISSGGYMGMDNELSAVPPTAFRYNAENDTLQLGTSKETLANSPHFKAGEWPDFNQPAYAGSVYQAYKIEPYFNADTANESDNTARNVRDRNNGMLTPLDQGNNQTDIKTTANIRKEIIANNDMSTNAKNVIIVTRDGHVTLRGPVNTTEEKRLIGEIANRIAQAQNVDNQLEVQITTSSNN